MAGLSEGWGAVESLQLCARGPAGAEKTHRRIFRTGGRNYPDRSLR
jgi:hypothetical protein